MTFTTKPLFIEHTSLTTGGWAPDAEPVSAPDDAMLDALNLIPDLSGTGAITVRAGFKRIREEVAVTGGSHYIKHIFPYRRDATAYLICVLTDESSNANNVQLWRIKLSDNTVARIDTSGVTWANPKSNHWGLDIQNTFYGGSPGNDVYSWDGTTWDATANTGSWDTLVDSISPTGAQKARDFAFKDDSTITYSGDEYTPVKGIRYETWNSGDRYVKGDRVSRKAAIGGQTYWRSYRSIKSHVADTDKAPGTGADTATYWKPVRLPLPVNDDSEVDKKWYFVPVAPGSSVAEWHASRFWIRYDGQGDKSRLLFSAPLDFEKHADVADVVFDMTDFQPGNDIKGPGGGWIPFNDGKKGGVIEALHSYGPYLLVFKRRAVWALSGLSEESFTPKKVAGQVGAVGPDCVAELDGLVYFLSDDGLYVTDGNDVEPVPGNEKVSQTIKARIDSMNAVGDGRDPQVWHYDDRVWISLPDSSASEKHWTLVYDPKAASFWKTNLPVLAARPSRSAGVQHLYFSAPPTYGVSDDLVYEYDHDDAGDQDDTAADTYAAVDIAWHFRTAWWPFGVHREQRRIRRWWMIVKGAITFTQAWYRDWNDSDTGSVARAVAVSYPTHIEGEWFADSHAVSFKLSGTEGPATINGIAVDTELRRSRYHT
jgi:hypothetical protein